MKIAQAVTSAARSRSHDRERTGRISVKTRKEQVMLVRSLQRRGAASHPRRVFSFGLSHGHWRTAGARTACSMPIEISETAYAGRDNRRPANIVYLVAGVVSSANLRDDRFGPSCRPRDGS